ncbi:MAG: L,D-transpeptidase family protein [Roseovarius sp.]|nr:L,D-transpeptidase family protein [Roseovarius sp.]
MRFTRRSAIVVTLAGLASFATSATAATRFRQYHGPEVTDILISKKRRKMWLMHGTRKLRKYRIGLGFAPEGHKQFEGDGKTPEGTYRIDRRNPNSDFHLSLGISYPNHNDVAFARSSGKSPGGDIFIHGKPNKKSGTGPDWTAGCISVSNRHIEEIYAMVSDGTYVTIHP